MDICINEFVGMRKTLFHVLIALCIGCRPHHSIEDKFRGTYEVGGLELYHPYQYISTHLGLRADGSCFIPIREVYWESNTDSCYWRMIRQGEEYLIELSTFDPFYTGKWKVVYMEDGYTNKDLRRKGVEYEIMYFELEKDSVSLSFYR
jgi:hypothetical protein